MLFKKIMYRIFQRTMFVFSYLLKVRVPIIIKGEDAQKMLVRQIIIKKYRGVLLVTDPQIRSLGLTNYLEFELNKNKIKFQVFDQTRENPPFDDVYQALKIYQDHDLEAIIALGGGSVMDLAKVVGALSVKKNKKIEQLKGLFKVRKRIPDLYCLPTTAGSGSETTLTAVVTNPQTKEKFTINDPSIVPHYAIFDPGLLVSLPPQILAITGMDALTHAIEAYIGKSTTQTAKRRAKEAIVLIDQALLDAYHTKAKDRIMMMQEASFKAGLAFRTSYVGYIHSMAHALGGAYQIQHGFANAVLMPYVLRAYGKKVEKKLGEISDLINLTDKSLSNEMKAKALIEKIETMNQIMKIPNQFYFKIDQATLEVMASYAVKEANPLYPVPKILFKEDIKKIYLAASHDLD